MRALKTDKKAEGLGLRLPSNRGPSRKESNAADYLIAGRQPPERLSPALSRVSRPADQTRLSQLLGRLQQTYGNQHLLKALRAGSESDGNGPILRAGLDGLLDAVKRKSLSSPLDWAAMVSCLGDADIPPAQRAMLALAVHSAHGEQVMVQLMDLTAEGRSLHSYIIGRETSGSGTDTESGDAAGVEDLTCRLERGMESSSLAPGIVREMESLMVSRFGDVRVHAGRQSAKLASALGVQAFTVGRDVFFGENMFQPGTRRGKALLAHELAHVVQQQNATAAAQAIPRCASSAALEREAQRAAVAIACGLPMLVTARTASVSLQGAAVVASFAIPTGRSGMKNSGGRVHESFEMHIDWDTTSGTPAHGEYRQYIKGYFKINGVEITKPLYGGANLEKTVYHEDGDGAGFRYGHRADAGSTSDVFSNPNRATGSRYRGWDDPGVRGPSGTTVDFSLTFKGQTFDTSQNKHGAANVWTVAFSGTIA